MAPSTGSLATLLIFSLLSVLLPSTVSAWESRFFSKTSRPRSISTPDSYPLFGEQSNYDSPISHGAADVPPPPSTSLTTGSYYPEYSTETTSNGEALGRRSFDSKYDNERYYGYYYRRGAGRGEKKGQREASTAGDFENGGYYYGSERGQENGEGYGDQGYDASGQGKYGEDNKYTDREYYSAQEEAGRENYVNP